jgi:hypothetical protein
MYNNSLIKKYDYKLHKYKLNVLMHHNLNLLTGTMSMSGQGTA